WRTLFFTNNNGDSHHKRLEPNGNKHTQTFRKLIMKKLNILVLAAAFIFVGCNNETKKENGSKAVAPLNAHLEAEPEATKMLNDSLPTIGLLMYDGVLTTEVTAAADVFTKHSAAG